jgi:hypothetical protein
MSIIGRRGNLSKKCFQIALSTLLLLNKAKGQNSESYPEIKLFWAPKEIKKFKHFKLLIQDEYKLISETNDTIVLEKNRNSIFDITTPVEIIVEKKGNNKGKLNISLNDRKQKIKLISDFIFFNNYIYTLTLNPEGQIHKTFILRPNKNQQSHYSHKSHRSHYSHYSSNPK